MATMVDATTLETIMIEEGRKAATEGRDLVLTGRLFLVMGLWVAYLIGGGVLWTRSPGATLLMVPVVGGYLFAWMAYYRHELWHNYFPGIPNPLVYKFVSTLLFSDPQVYGLCHASHHKNLHSDLDLEFFCEGYRTDRKKRRRQFILEILFGNMAWEVDTIFRLKRAGKLNVLKARISLAMRVGLFAVLATLAETLAPGAGLATIFVFFLTAWWGALITRHNQWLEHLGLCDNDADLKERIMMTLALPDASPGSWMFNFMNHNDPHEHVLHHLYPKVNSRSTGLPVPEGSPVTNLPEYGRRIVAHYRSL